eukprot:3185865-Lingulodinium_polyedra.AAC.1
MQATFAVATQEPVRANCIERPYMGKDGKISPIFKRNAQKSKNWRPNREIWHALDNIEPQGRA